MSIRRVRLVAFFFQSDSKTVAFYGWIQIDSNANVVWDHNSFFVVLPSSWTYWILIHPQIKLFWTAWTRLLYLIHVVPYVSSDWKDKPRQLDIYKHKRIWVNSWHWQWQAMSWHPFDLESEHFQNRKSEGQMKRCDCVSWAMVLKFEGVATKGKLQLISIFVLTNYFAMNRKRTTRKSYYWMKCSRSRHFSFSLTEGARLEWWFCFVSICVSLRSHPIVVQKQNELSRVSIKLHNIWNNLYLCCSALYSAYS